MRHTRKQKTKKQKSREKEETIGQLEIKAIVWALGQVLTASVLMLARVQLLDDLTPAQRVWAEPELDLLTIAYIHMYMFPVSYLLLVKSVKMIAAQPQIIFIG